MVVIGLYDCYICISEIIYLVMGTTSEFSISIALLNNRESVINLLKPVSSSIMNCTAVESYELTPVSSKPLMICRFANLYCLL